MRQVRNSPSRQASEGLAKDGYDSEAKPAALKKQKEGARPYSLSMKGNRR
jgi:hypothetical protein